MKKIKFLLFVLLIGTLSGCSAVSETFYDIKTETNKTYQSEVSKMDMKQLCQLRLAKKLIYLMNFQERFMSCFQRKV